MFERCGDLGRAISVNFIVVEIADDNAMNFGRGIEKSIGFDIEY